LHAKNKAFFFCEKANKAKALIKKSGLPKEFCEVNNFTIQIMLALYHNETGFCFIKRDLKANLEIVAIPILWLKVYRFCKLQDAILCN
jgi:hypothetical protein